MNFNETLIITLITITITTITNIILFLIRNKYTEKVELKAKTISILVFYANLIHNPVNYDDIVNNSRLLDMIDKASNDLRALAAEWAIYYNNEKAKEIHSLLIGLSNSLTYTNSESLKYLMKDNIYHEKKIKELLKINNKKLDKQKNI
ncbi:hypothetical protein MNZ20_001965 [Clostridium perfringens]|nr:hypothetical protein [Clostridium perfringens]